MSDAEIRHDLFVYDTDAAAVAQVEPFVVAGLEADEAVMVIVGAAKQRLLREAVGAAAEFVLFTDATAVYRRPETAMAILDGIVRQSTEALDAGLRVYGELPVCRTQAEWNGWIAYESVVNRAFANRPVVFMCGYDGRVVPEAVVRQAHEAHRVVHAGVWQLSRDYREPEALVRSLAPAFEVLPGLRPLPIADGRLHDRLAEALAAEAVPAPRARDLLVAAGEVFANAERYGNGVRSLRAGRAGECFVCEVKDAGSGLDDALAGYLPPAPLAPHGSGLWIARQLTSRLELSSAPDGLTVRLWI
jgi:MEDS: MEthanogen/methylotroph, DcmR Sensory domain/Histidine kinase-like ATPase domain